MSEVRYRYRLAIEHLERAERLFSLRDWVGAVSASQMAVENFAKVVIVAFEVPTWSHDPSNQLNGMHACLARELAPEHGRSSYGEPIGGMVPSDIYREDHASNALEKGRKAREITEKVLNRLNIRLKQRSGGNS